ncbi:MAG: hypothetical protein AUH31_00250 [Armatimonadetes bacterium 13_1_40CM_64_14]|nr:MAG: hypothetical protein AUH31_00250 [Armatimonadetes bacterium 13_1_40CM_64_14]
MIVGMSRVLVFGPKRLLGQVIEEVQRLGTVHIDRIEAKEAPAVQPLQLGEEDTKTLQVLERALARVDGLLGLLPPVPADPGPPPADSSLEAIDAETTELDRRVRDLTRLRLELEEEHQLIDSYGGAIRVLSPLLSALSGSQAFQTIGFLLNTKDLTVVAALRNELVKATDGRVEVVSRIVDDRRIGVVVAFLRPEAERVRAVLSRVGAVELRLPARFAQEGPAETIATMQRRKAEIPAELERLDGELRARATSARPSLLASRAWLADRLAQLKVVPELAQSHYTFILYGWAPTRAVLHVRQALHSRFSSDIVVSDEPADAHVAPERVPVLLDNPPFIHPFQRLLALFQPPRYGAWDPSPVVAITFPIFVGLVIGDVGYGLLMFWGGWKLRQMARAGRVLTINFLSLRFAPQLLSDLSFLMRVCASWIIFFGAIYLEFFGNVPELVAHKYHLPIRPIFDRLAPENQPPYFLSIIAAGIVMIFLGLGVHLVETLRHRHYVGVFESLVIMLGTAGLLLFLGAQGALLPAGLGSSGLYLFGAAVVVAGISLVAERDVIKRFLWLLESTSALGHILSHARLMAFGLAAAALAKAANDLGAQFGTVGVIAAVLIAAFFQSLFLIFTIFGHIIQPARLHWVEFFSKFKFHEENGRAYRPFQKSAAPGR